MDNISAFKKFQNSDVVYQLLIWLLLIGPHGYFNSNLIAKSLLLLFYVIAVSDGLLIIIVYITIYKLIPKLYKKGKYLIFFLWLALLFAVYVAACIKMEIDITTLTKSESMSSSYFLYYFFGICRYTLIGFLFFSLKEKADQKKQLDRMKVEKLQSEINYLRAQINPHFLFNTLNNLYGLALEKSERTPEMIIRLSKMMDYMLYELEGTKVLLKRDIENLENYIDLERIRQGNNALIQYTCEGEIDNQVIEPLLMLPLIENAFKHGVNQIVEGAVLQILISVAPSSLSLLVKNNYLPQNDKNNQIHSSIGIDNLRKRLKLFYPQKNSLSIRNENAMYEVTLKLEL